MKNTRKNLYKIIRPKLLLSSTVLAFFTSLACANTSVTNTPFNQTAVLKKELKTINVNKVNVSTTGLIYVAKEDSKLKFWSLSNDDTFYELLKVEDISHVQDGQLIINLNGSPTGLFYSDNLFDNPNLQILFKSNMVNGKIALPVDHADFEKISLYVNTIGQQVNIIDYEELQLLVNKKVEVFNLVDISQIDLLENIDNFKELMKSQIIANLNYAEDNLTFGSQLIDSYETELSVLQNTMSKSLQLDVSKLELESQSIFSQMNNIIQQEQQITSCLNNTFSEAEGLASTLTTSLSNTNVGNNIPVDEDLIQQTEQSLNLAATNMLECVEINTNIENYDPSNLFDYQLYEDLSNNFSRRLDSSEVDVMQWENNLQVRGQQLMDSFGLDDLTASIEIFEDYFSHLMSQKFKSLNQNISQSTNSLKQFQNNTLSTIAPLSLENDKAYEKTQGMCENDVTFFVSFELGDINVVIGTPWDDVIITEEKNDLIIAWSGDDCIESHAGYDLVLGGRGQDRIYLGDDHDIAHGGAGEDEIHGSSGNTYEFSIEIKGVEVDISVAIGNLILGGAGNDNLFGGEVSADPGENFTIEENGFADLILGDGFLFGSDPGEDIIEGEMGIDFIFGLAMDDTLSNVVGGIIKVDEVDVPMGSYFWGNRGDDTIIGSATFNLLVGTGDFIWGNDGNDNIQARNGKDFVFGGNGRDNIDGGNGRDFLFGGNDDDIINGNNGIDFIFSGNGDDISNGGNGLDLIFGNDGEDFLQGNNGPDIISGGAGQDEIRGNDGLDYIKGGDDADIIEGNNSLDILLGNDGEDIISGREGWDFIFGGAGIDTLFGNDGNDLIVGGSNPDNVILEFISGGNGIDFLWGNSGNDRIEGNNGLDFIRGDDNIAIGIFAGDDIIEGGNGIDIILGDDGNDQIQGNDFPDFILGNRGNDLINGNAGSDIIAGNNGCDTLFGGDQIDLIFGGLEIDNIQGGNGMDFLIGGFGQDIMLGNAGIDFMYGGGDIDFMDGGAGFDVLLGGDGDDHILGGNQNDLLIGGLGADFINGQGAGDLILGGIGNDRLVGGEGNDILIGGMNNDRISANNGTDLLFGGFGNDRLQAIEGFNLAIGGENDDVLDGFFAGGFDARDILLGSAGNDFISGNAFFQTDIRLGGSGTDTRVWGVALVLPAEFDAVWNPVNCNN